MELKYTLEYVDVWSGEEIPQDLPSPAFFHEPIFKHQADRGSTVHPGLRYWYFKEHSAD